MRESPSLSGPLIGLADVDAARGEVDVRPAQREHLAGAQAGQGADPVGDVQRLGEREEEAAHVVEPLDERRLLRGRASAG